MLGAISSKNRVYLLLLHLNTIKQNINSSKHLLTQCPGAIISFELILVTSTKEIVRV